MKRVSVIGGGPAGLAAAIAARRKGFAATVSDARTPPIDKACGEGLMPNGVEAAEELGLDLNEAEPMRGVRFICGDRVVEAPFPGRPAYGFRRTALHDALVRQAEREGVELRWGAPVQSPPHAEWVVRATGATPCTGRFRYGFRQHFRVDRWTDYLEVHWSEGRQLYITPTASDEVGIAVLTASRAERINEAISHFPVVEKRLIAPTSRERGAMTGARQVPDLVAGRAALIGDASGTVDAITGEGLALSFRCAFALADAMAREDLTRYERVHRNLFRRPRLMANLLLTLGRHTSAFTLLQANPWLFRTMLGFHVNS